MTELFGPYELTAMLGRGGMGEVWQAVDTRKSRTVALKRLPAEMTGEREFEDRFRREAHAAARLNDPHVIPIHDFGEIEGRLYLDMRLVHGRDLADVIAENGALAPSRAVSVIEQVASALDAAHDEGLVHRDVKPSNILLTSSKRTVGPQDFVYLIDFGIATGAALGTRLTQTGMAIGTAAYMAPERFAEGIDNDPRIDVYALGCVLHEMLTGQAPFPGREFASLMYQHLNTAPPEPSRLVTTVSPAFDRVVATALSKDRDTRFAHAGELAAAAREALGARPAAAPDADRRAATPRPSGRPARHRTPGGPPADRGPGGPAGRRDGRATAGRAVAASSPAVRVGRRGATAARATLRRRSHHRVRPGPAGRDPPRSRLLRRHGHGAGPLLDGGVGVRRRLDGAVRRRRRRRGIRAGDRRPHRRRAPHDPTRHDRMGAAGDGARPHDHRRGALVT